MDVESIGYVHEKGKTRIPLIYRSGQRIEQEGTEGTERGKHRTSNTEHRTAKGGLVDREIR